MPHRQRVSAWSDRDTLCRAESGGREGPRDGQGTFWALRRANRLRARPGKTGRSSKGWVWTVCGKVEGGVRGGAGDLASPSAEGGAQMLLKPQAYGQKFWNLKLWPQPLCRLRDGAGQHRGRTPPVHRAPGTP